MLTELAAQTVWTSNSRRTIRTIRCTRGQLWVTREGDIRDYCLACGEQHSFPEHGRLVVIGLTDAAFIFEEQLMGKRVLVDWLFSMRHVAGLRIENRAGH